LLPPDPSPEELEPDREPGLPESGSPEPAFTEAEAEGEPDPDEPVPPGLPEPVVAPVEGVACGVDEPPQAETSGRAAARARTREGSSWGERIGCLSA
jgi:hypothetical protein